MKFLDLINEEVRKRKYEYGCVMLYFAFPEMHKFHNKIIPDEIYTEDDDDSFGLEDEPHVTLLYGFHGSVTTDDVVKILDNFEFGDCYLYNPSLFTNEKYDVLKFDVKGDGLHEVNEALKALPHTNDYPEYHPHMTVAYIKKGKGKKYADMFKKYDEFTVTPRYAMFSKTTAEKDRIKIKLK